jgi:predicted anti-sigma-YlaC factor YlaD
LFLTFERRIKKMFQNLSALALGIVVFAIVIGVGVVVLGKFGNAVGGTANTTVQSLITDLGTSGLAGWTSAIIALAVGLLFIGALMNKRAY